MIELKNVSKSYTSKQGIVNALNGINLKLPNNGFIIIRGNSHSGKSTLLNIIGCLEKVDCGNIILNEVDLPKVINRFTTNYINQAVGFIFEDNYLINSLSVYDK